MKFNRTEVTFPKRAELSREPFDYVHGNEDPLWCHGVVSSVRSCIETLLRLEIHGSARCATKLKTYKNLHSYSHQDQAIEIYLRPLHSFSLFAIQLDHNEDETQNQCFH